MVLPIIARQDFGGNLHGTGGREYRQRREVGPRHAHHFCIGTAAADADPVIFQQFDRDIAIGQQLHVVVKLTGWDGTGAFFLDLGRTRGAQAQVKIRGSKC